MRLVRLRTAALAALPLAAIAVLAPTAAHAAPTPEFTPVGPGVQTPLMAGTTPTSTFVGDDAELSPAVPRANTAKITVQYNGFSAAAKASFQRAVNTWQQNVKTSVPIIIQANYKPLPQNVLGSAGSAMYYTQNSTKSLFVEALTDKLVGKQVRPGKADIIANFSSSFNNWYFGTGRSPSKSYDFQSVVTHELGHGLGFLGSGYVSGSTGQVGSQGYYFAYDRAVKNGAGKSLLSFPNKSAAMKGQLTGGSLFFDNSTVRGANGGKPAKIFAPKQWEQGSSYSHLDEATYGPGNKNSLMTPVLNPGEQIHSPGPIMLAIFKTIGW